MASDRKQFKRARKKWLELYHDQNFSVPSEAGKMAVMCSYDVQILDEMGRETTKERINYRKEAFAIADILHNEGRGVELVLNCQEQDFCAVLTDPDISDIVTIGHGCFSSFCIHSSTTLDWTFIAEEADHLKQGSFVQRQCGIFNYDTPVPFGMFSVANAANVFAATGEYFNPHGLRDPRTVPLRPVTDAQMLDYEGVHALRTSFTNEQITKGS